MPFSNKLCSTCFFNIPFRYPYPHENRFTSTSSLRASTHNLHPQNPTSPIPSSPCPFYFDFPLLLPTTPLTLFTPNTLPSLPQPPPSPPYTSRDGKEVKEGRRGVALWSGSTKNRDVSTGPLARPFARSLAPLTR